MFEIDAVFLTDEHLANLVDIGTSQRTSFAVLVVELERAVQLLVIVGISEAAVAIAVPEDAITFIGKYERNTDLRVILEQVFIETLHVQVFCLMLPQSVESLVGRRVELSMPCPSLFLFIGEMAVSTDFSLRNDEAFEGFAFLLSLGEQFVSTRIEELDTACLSVNDGTYRSGLYNDVTAFLAYGVTSLILLWYNNQTLFCRELTFRCGLHTDDLVVYNL